MSVLNNVKNKYERSRSSKRQKIDSKPVFNARRGRSDFNRSYSFSQNSGRSSVHGQAETKLNSSNHSPPEGVVIDVESDHLRSVVTPPGRRLLLYYKVWLQSECHLRVALILKHSYRIFLQQPIKLLQTPTILSGYASQQKQTFLLECEDQMLWKNTIISIRMCASLGFYSRLFFVPKRGKKWSPVTDLSVEQTSFLYSNGSTRNYPHSKRGKTCAA